MDPVATLTRIRDIVASILSSTDAYSTHHTPTDLCEDFAEHFDALDSWINNQGFSPWASPSLANVLPSGASLPGGCSTGPDSLPYNRSNLARLRDLATQINSSDSSTLDYEDTAEDLAAAFSSLDIYLTLDPSALHSVWCLR